MESLETTDDPEVSIQPEALEIEISVPESEGKQRGNLDMVN